MRVIGLIAAMILTLLVIGCAAPPAANASRLADLRAAISGLEVAPDHAPGSAYDAAWRLISGCESPDELREIVRHFSDKRPTMLLESLENPNGGRVEYTIGDALFFSLKGRFFDQLSYMLPGRNCPKYFKNEATFVDWLEEYDYDIARLRKAYKRDTPKDS
jgi:hypothetical protein